MKWHRSFLMVSEKVTRYASATVLRQRDTSVIGGGRGWAIQDYVGRQDPASAEWYHAP